MIQYTINNFLQTPSSYTTFTKRFYCTLSNLKYIEKYIECLQIFVTEFEIGKMLLI